MSQVVQTWDLTAQGSQTNLLTTELNSLASSSGLTAGAISSVGGASGAFTNIQGTAGLGGWQFGLFELNLAAPAGALTAGTAAYVWFVKSIDGSNYGDGSATVIPARAPDIIIPVRAVSTAQRPDAQIFQLPPGTWFVVIAQNTGQTWAASGNTFRVLPLTQQIG